MSAEDEEPDGLIQASFTIHASGADRLRDGNDPIRQFPGLEKYEATDGPAESRQRNFRTSFETIEIALEHTVKSLFDGLVSDIQTFCLDSSTTQYVLPGSALGKRTKRLSAAAIVGPQYTAQFRDKVKNSFLLREDTYWVELQSRECSSLSASLQLILARVFSQVPGGKRENVSSSLTGLTSLPHSSNVILYLSSLAQYSHTLLNDLIKSLHASSQLPNFPRLTILLGLEGGSPTWEEKIDHESTPLLDLRRLYTPLPVVAFEHYMQHFFLMAKVDGSRLWPGPSVLEYLQYQYFDRGFSLDDLVSTLKLAFHHHFTVRPLSSLIDLDEARPLGEEDWHPLFFLRARSQFMLQGRDGTISIPDSRSDNPSQERCTRILKELLVEDIAVMGHACYDLADLLESGREEMKAAIHILHSLQSQYLTQVIRSESMSLLRRPRTSTLGGLTFEVMSGFDMSKLIARATNELRKASLESIARSLETIVESEWTEDSEMFNDTLAEYIDKIRNATDAEGEIGDVSNINAGSREDAGKKVQARWLRIEAEEALKKEVADWLSSTLNKWLSSRPPVPNIYTYDFTTYINQLTDPSTRSQTVAALNNPHLVLRTSKDTPPDISRLYEMYQSAGRMINLADWYQAFSQSIKAKRTSLGKRQRQQTDDEDNVQARFALSVNEMGKMGFLKKTRRKPDHVLKVVHDLPTKET